MLFLRYIKASSPRCCEKCACLFGATCRSCTLLVHYNGACDICHWTSLTDTFNVGCMIEPKLLDDLAERLAGTVPGGLQILQDDLHKSLRAVLESGLSRLNLVTREEFEVQATVLARTRAKLEQLEKQIQELEKRC